MHAYENQYHRCDSKLILEAEREKKKSYIFLISPCVRVWFRMKSGREENEKENESWGLLCRCRKRRTCAEPGVTCFLSAFEARGHASRIFFAFENSDEQLQSKQLFEIFSVFFGGGAACIHIAYYPIPMYVRISRTERQFCDFLCNVCSLSARHARRLVFFVFVDLRLNGNALYHQSYVRW